MKYVVCIHLCIPWKFGEWGSTPRGARRPSLSVCFFCPSRYDARHRKPRRCVYVLNSWGTGIRPPDSFSYCSNFRFRSSFRFRSRSSSSLQQAATYSIAAVAGNWTILVYAVLRCRFFVHGASMLLKIWSNSSQNFSFFLHPIQHEETSKYRSVKLKTKTWTAAATALVP